MTAGTRLEDVGPSNWRAVCDVEPRPEQARFVTSTARYLCLCHYGDDWNPVAIVHDDQVVGFAMWAVDTDDSRWIGGLVVDAAWQGRGIGEAAVRLLVEMLTAQAGATNIALSYEPDNHRARALYRRLGFVETGEVEDDEVIARLTPG